MIITLEDTSTRDIASALLRARHSVGPASGMVHTLIVVSDEEHRPGVVKAARASAITHPSRVLVVTYTTLDTPRLDAEIQVGEGIPGDLIHLTLSAGLRDRADSVLLPLLLPDSPTVAWWPHNAPIDVAKDPIGTLATRRITDAAGTDDPPAALLERALHHTAGDTDLTWTRLTRWRSLLALALDQHPATVTQAQMWAAPDNAPAMLLQAWLEDRLNVTVEIHESNQPGVSKVCLTTADGDITIDRADRDTIAMYAVPGQPERKVALQRRELTVLLNEELARLDPDVVFETAVGRLAQHKER